MSVRLPPVLLVGPAGSGKDTLGDYWSQALGYRRFAIADGLRAITATEAVHELLPEAHHCASRVWLQALGDAVRAVNPQALVRRILDQVTTLAPGTPWVITDVRLAEEVTLLRKAVPSLLVVGCLVPTPLRIKRLVARDGYIPPRHPTEDEGEAIALSKDVDFYWFNDAPRIQSLIGPTAWLVSQALLAKGERL